MSTSTLSMRHQCVSCLHAHCSWRSTSLVPCRTPQPFLSTCSRNTRTRRARLFLYSTRSKQIHKSHQNVLLELQNCYGFATKLLTCIRGLMNQTSAVFQQNPVKTRSASAQHSSPAAHQSCFYLVMTYRVEALTQNGSLFSSADMPCHLLSWKPPVTTLGTVMGCITAPNLCRW